MPCSSKRTREQYEELDHTSHNKRLFRNGEYADFTIICKDRSWNLHRNIVLPRCEFFRACLQGEFLEASKQEVSLPDDEPEAVEGLLYYLYTLEYPTYLYEAAFRRARKLNKIAGCACSERNFFCAHAEASGPYLSSISADYWMFDLRLYSIAHKFNAKGLMDLTLSRIYGYLENEDGLWRFSFQDLSPGYVLFARYLAETQIEELAALRDEFFCITARYAAQVADIEPISKIVDEIPWIAKHWLRHLGFRTKREDATCKSTCKSTCVPKRKTVRAMDVWE